MEALETKSHHFAYPINLEARKENAPFDKSQNQGTILGFQKKFEG